MLKRLGDNILCWLNVHPRPGIETYISPKTFIRQFICRNCGRTYYL